VVGADRARVAAVFAALCAKHRCDPRTIRTDHITELQQALLKYDQSVPRVPNRDPADLARTAKVTASSAARGLRPTEDDLRPGPQYHDMAAHRRAMLLPIMHGKGVESVAVLLRSERSEPVAVRLHLREAAREDDFSATQDVDRADATVPPNGENWVTFKLGAHPKSDYAWVWIEPVKGVAWRLTERPFAQSCRAYFSAGGEGGETWVVRPESYACRFTPSAEARLDYSPSNVINGWSRPIGGASNMWRSDPDQAFPQWIELAFPSPVALNTVQVTFGTDLSSRRLQKSIDPGTGRSVLACVSDYDLEVFDGVAWHTVVKETGNFQRWRRHRFDEVTAAKLRLTIRATAAMDSAQIYELRAYKE